MAPQPNPDELQRKRAQILEEVMRTSRRQFWRQARRFTVNRQDADDAIEDACIAFLRYFRPEPDSNPTGWMMTTVKHAALAITDRSNRRRRNSAVPEAPDQHDQWWESGVPDPGDSPEEMVEAREWVAARAGLLSELKPDERTALSLLAFGFSHQEICARQGWSTRKAERCVVEGRARLRRLLDVRGEET
jgi:RNA polymerase sigma factor (sigma-70 family)